VAAQDFLRGASFHLVGTVTLVDTNRDLLVVQDDTGAVALNLPSGTVALRPGQRISVEGTNASPLVTSFPDFPDRPSGWDMQKQFEAPANWGDYHLTRMRGYLHPPVTGNYTFWIASDNTSELWLSPDDDPGKVTRIASVREWVNPREWTREPGQRSTTIHLEAGQVYYIEAFQQQITLDDHLAVAWEGPGLHQSVIEGRYLTPWVSQPDQEPFARQDVILREYWTNYFSGNLEGICGPRPFDSALTARGLQVTVLGEGTLPTPKSIPLGQPLLPEDKYLWVEVEGTISFAGNSVGSAIVELTDGQAQAQVRLPSWNGNWPTNLQSQGVRVVGVCEGARNLFGVLTPGLIWAPTDDCLSFTGLAETNQESLAEGAPGPLTATNNPVLRGFYGTYGVVTFNDRVFDKNCLFVQNGETAVFVFQDGPPWGKQLEVGQWIEVGGDVSPGKYIPQLRPLTLKTLDWRSIPEPLKGSIGEIKDGRWTEWEGVVRSVNANGTLTLKGKSGAVSVWLGHSDTNDLDHFVDSTLRARGVMSLTLIDSPVLLVPSRDFVQLQKEPPAEPFKIPLSTVAGLARSSAGTQGTHRSRIIGVITYKNNRSLFVQDASGGARVQIRQDLPLQVGDSVEILGFPETDTLIPTITEAQVRSGGDQPVVTAWPLDLNEAKPGTHSGSLVRMTATLLGQKTDGLFHVLELLEGSRVFEALLATNQGELPLLAAGSRVQITGVCDTEAAGPERGTEATVENVAAGTIRIWLRTPADVALLRGPPWWTWRKVVVLVGMLLTVLAGAMFWIHFLRRRLERQHAAQLAFSRQILKSQENERRRIAANLHDSLGQNLLVIKNQARLAMQPAKDESALLQRLDEISGMASQALEEVRQITHGLRPYQLDRLGLTQSIRTTINQVSESGPILFASDVENIDGLFDKESEIHIYRIVQESINNIVKHSGATEATIVIKRQPAVISLSIRDNGRGFDPSALSSDGSDPGFGLSGISERVRILGGNLSVHSQPAEGTDLRVEIPASYP
jgi:signal transduction histidine kinase